MSVLLLRYLIILLQNNNSYLMYLLYARSKTSDVLWYGVRPSVRLSVRPSVRLSVCPSVRPLATSCPLNILKTL